MSQVSIVICTFNEEENIERVMGSVKWADEIVVCDTHSNDSTVKLAKKHGAMVVTHKYTGFVEPVRNFAVSKASGEWVLVLDADEEVPATLAKKLQEIARSSLDVDYVEIPRKNMIFGHWMKTSMWWPDYNVRFFKKDKVVWSDKIHRQPNAIGIKYMLPLEEEYSIIHHHYDNIGQYMEKLNRYTSVEADELCRDGYVFKWTDLINKPVGEFLGRFFANRGFEDGIHGLSLCLLQSFSFLIVYLKVWEKSGFKFQSIKLTELESNSKEIGKQINYWIKYSDLPKNPFKRVLKKIRNKLP